MKTREELKALAKQQIKGNIGMLFLISLIISVITSAASAIIPAAGAIVAVIVTPAFTISLLRVYLNLAKGKVPEVKDTFAGFDDFWTGFKTSFLVGLFTFLWSLLLYVPGIIKAISYSQAMLIVAENPKISAREAINRSKEMMEGHKMDYFVLSLSFIGWILLGCITLGIAFIWVTPYMQATLINFYNDLKPVAEPVVETIAEEIAE